MSGTSLPETAPMRLTPPRITTASNMKMTAAVSFGEIPKAVASDPEMALLCVMLPMPKQAIPPKMAKAVPIHVHFGPRPFLM